MLKHPLNTFGATPDESITLLNGQVIPLIYVSFVPSNYHFYYKKGATTLDVTNLMTRAQKFNFPGFDQVEDNRRIYNETRLGGTGPVKDLETSTGKIFVENVSKDLDKMKNIGVGSLGATLGLVLGGYIVYQLFMHSKKGA